jgi:hypothetical protein
MNRLGLTSVNNFLRNEVDKSAARNFNPLVPRDVLRSNGSSSDLTPLV